MYNTVCPIIIGDVFCQSLTGLYHDTVGPIITGDVFCQSVTTGLFHDYVFMFREVEIV